MAAVNGAGDLQRSFGFDARHVHALAATDGALTATVSPAIAILTPTDLTVQFGAVTIPNRAIPGDRGNVSVVVTNQGRFSAVGSMAINLYLCTSDDETSGGTLLERFYEATGYLAYERSSTYTFYNVQLPANLPYGTYYLRADINATQTIPEVELRERFGLFGGAAGGFREFGAVGARRNVVLNLTDSDGTIATFMLPGAGTGTVTAGADGWDLDVTGSTAASVLTIATRKSTTPGDDGHQLELRHRGRRARELRAVRSVNLDRGDGRQPASSEADAEQSKRRSRNLDRRRGDRPHDADVQSGSGREPDLRQHDRTADGRELGERGRGRRGHHYCAQSHDGNHQQRRPGREPGYYRRRRDHHARDTGGSVSGNITDAGGLTTLIVDGGSVTGGISAGRVGMVTVTGGDVSGSITSTESALQLGALTGIGIVMVNGGDLSGNLDTSGGDVGTIIVSHSALSGSWRFHQRQYQRGASGAGDGDRRTPSSITSTESALQLGALTWIGTVVVNGAT